MEDQKVAVKKTRAKTVKMFGTGNFVIEDRLYAFRDGETVKVQKASDKPILESEAKRREALFNKTERIISTQQFKEA